MLKMIKKLVRDTKAQDLAEYGIALAVIGAGAAAAAVAIAGAVDGIWATASGIIAGV